MRLIAIGDIHGHLGKLIDLVNQVQPTPDDQLVFLGDYIDRGPNSKGAIDYLISFQEQHPETEFIRGNHEQLMLDALHYQHPERLPADWQTLANLDPGYGRDTRHDGDVRMWLKNGGDKALFSYGAREEDIEYTDLRCEILCWPLVPQEHIDFLTATKFWYWQDRFMFVHAGRWYTTPKLKDQIFTLLWERYADRGRDGVIHVVGHHPTTDGQPLFEEGRYSLDTGAGHGKLLTACDVMTQQIWQAG